MCVVFLAQHTRVTAQQLGHVLEESVHMPALWVCLHMSTLLHALTSADWPLWCGFSAGVRWCGIIVFIVFYHRAETQRGGLGLISIGISVIYSAKRCGICT